MAVKKKTTVFNKTAFLKKTEQDVIVAAAEDLNESIFPDDPTDTKQSKADLLESLLQDAEAVNVDDELKPETWEFLIAIGCESALQRKAEMEERQPDDSESEKPAEEKPVEEETTPDSEKTADEKPAEPKKAEPKKAKHFSRIDAAAGAMKEKLDTVDGLIDRSSELYVEKGGAEKRTQSASYINCILAGMVAAGAVSIKEGAVTYNF